jgi:hypothetical protein
LGIIAAMIVAGGSLTVVAAAASAGPVSRAPVSRTPRIVARPASVMVNTKTELLGSGFRPHSRLTIWECSQRTWVVPLQVCNHKNAVHVRTSGAGRFRVSLVALVCPVHRRAMAPAGFSRTCYAGVPTVRGVDTVTLVGAAKFTVTGP